MRPYYQKAKAIFFNYTVDLNREERAMAWHISREKIFCTLAKNAIQTVTYLLL